MLEIKGYNHFGFTYDRCVSIIACRSDVIYALMSAIEFFPMNQLRDFLLPILLLLILSGAAQRLAAQNEGAEKVKEPVQARIEGKHRTDPSFVVGDVMVIYKDGTTDSWTLKGNCMDPKVSHQGQVGWVLCELAADGKSLKLNDNAPIGSQGGRLLPRKSYRQAPGCQTIHRGVGFFR